MNCVNARCSHYTPLVNRVLCGVLLCALAGCWQEVAYTPPDGEDEPESPAPTSAQADEDAHDFADDLATSLAAQPAAAPSGEAASAAGDAEPTDVTPLFDDSPPATTDRYAAANTATPPSEPLDRYAMPPAATPAEPADSGGLLFGDDSDVETTDGVPPVAPASADDPTAASPPVSSGHPRAAASRNSRRIAWLLGSKLSLAALANDRGVESADVAKWFSQSQTLAKLIGTSLAALPPRSGAADSARDPDQALDYLFSEGQRLGRHLASRFGDDHAALFELAVKSNILLALYRPKGPVVDALRDAIIESSRRADVPDALAEPLVALLADGADETAVQEAVFEFHADVDRFLTTSP